MAGAIIDRLNGSSFCMSSLIVSNVISRVGLCSFCDEGWPGSALWSTIEFDAAAAGIAAGDERSLQPVSATEAKTADSQTQVAEIGVIVTPLPSAFCFLPSAFDIIAASPHRADKI